jgi:hypothetical protein
MEDTMKDGSANGASTPPASHVSKARLTILRALYLFIMLGLALFVWPAFLAKLPAPPHSQGVMLTMLAAFSLLCAVGIRYPLQMIPILLWELVWKSMWLLVVALPRWMAGTMDAATTQTVIDCLVGVVLVPLALPWRYIIANYLKRPADRWASAGPGTPSPPVRMEAPR